VFPWTAVAATAAIQLVDYIDSGHSDEADHDEGSAARKIHPLLLSEIPTPAWQDIVMDRSAWTKVLRSIYTN
jgi:hypothetical protein